MGIQLGNLQLKDVVHEKYLEIIQNFLDKNGYRKENKCNDVNKKRGNYHIYDIPRLFVVCDLEKVKQFHSFLLEKEIIEEAFKGTIQLCNEELVDNK